MTTEVDDRLIAKLQELADRSDDLHDQLIDPAVASDPARSIAITKELGRLRRLVDPFKEFRKVRDDLEEARAIVSDRSHDAELRDLAGAEVEELQTRHDEILETLKEAIITGDEAAIGSVILEIRAGTGGDEAALFARDLYDMYSRFCDRKGFKVEVLDQNGSDLGGLKEVILNTTRLVTR